MNVSALRQGGVILCVRGGGLMGVLAKSRANGDRTMGSGAKGSRGGEDVGV